MRIDGFSSLLSSGLAAVAAGQARMAEAGAPLMSGDIDSLPESMVGLSLGKATLRIGIHLIHTADDLFQSTLDMLA